MNTEFPLVIKFGFQDSGLWLRPCIKPFKDQIQNCYFGTGNRKRLLMISSRASLEALLSVIMINYFSLE